MSTKPIEVMCMNTGDVFRSVSAAARAYGIIPATLQKAISKGRPCKGLIFEITEPLEMVTARKAAKDYPLYTGDDSQDFQVKKHGGRWAVLNPDGSVRCHAETGWMAYAIANELMKEKGVTAFRKRS